MQAFVFLQEVEHDCLPKLIVTDHFLPGMTGTEFLNDLKAMEKYKHIPVVVLASTKSKKELERYKELGALDYVIKPDSYDEYVEVAAAIKSQGCVISIGAARVENSKEIMKALRELQ
jgi:CheY-like chemotaxis protein